MRQQKFEPKDSKIIFKEEVSYEIYLLLKFDEYTKERGGRYKKYVQKIKKHEVSITTKVSELLNTGTMT
jgi:hypothetical protein